MLALLAVHGQTLGAQLPDGPDGPDGAGQPARLLWDGAAVPYPPIAREARLAGDFLVIAVVDTGGRVAGAPTITGVGHAVLRGVLGPAARRWRFEPARIAGRPVIDTVVVRVLMRPPTPSERPEYPITCTHCDPERERHRRAVVELARAHAQCDTALRVLARTNHGDALASAVEVAVGCQGGERAAALAVRLMNFGYHADSVNALRVRLATAFPSADVFDAALAVAGAPASSAQPFALEVLARLSRSTPRALADLVRSDAPRTISIACGPFVLDSVPRPTDQLRAAYVDRARDLARRLLDDATASPAMRRAARCLMDEL